ncbi:MAG: hypothetical protein ACYTGW_18145 [Planctomycetota bacterium]|jgi:hypothetical protein
MRASLLPLCAGLLAATVSAQVASTDVVVAESSGLTLLDPITSKTRPVQGTPAGAFTRVALNPLYPIDVWGISSGLRICAGFSPPLDYFNMTGDRITKTVLGCRDFALSFGILGKMHTFRDALLFALSGSPNGVYTRARGATKSTLVASGNANCLALLGEKIYFSTTDTPNAIVEVDMTTSTPKTRTLKLVLDPKAPTGSKLPTTISAMCANGPEPGADSLAVFDNKGVLYIVKPGAPATTHNVTTTNKPGIAAPIDAVYHPKVPLNLIVATSNKLYDALQYVLPSAKPLYTSSGTINDIDYSAGGVAFYGKGCQGTNARTPEMVFGGLPYQGNSNFAVRMRNGNPSSLARLVIGFSNTTWNTNMLPLDLGFMGAGGCNLLASIDVMLTVGTDSKGEISIVNKVPVDSKLVGVTVYTQFAVADKVNPAGLVTSNAMQLVIR